MIRLCYWQKRSQAAIAADAAASALGGSARPGTHIAAAAHFLGPLPLRGCKLPNRGYEYVCSRLNKRWGHFRRVDAAIGQSLCASPPRAIGDQHTSLEE